MDHPISWLALADSAQFMGVGAALTQGCTIMATGDFLPTREADLLMWSASFSAHISATPGVFGLSIAQADQYATLHDTFSAAYFTTQHNLKRTPASIAAKNTARDALIADARQLSRQIQGTPGITDQQRVSLGLAVQRKDAAPVRKPAVAPSLIITSTTGRDVTIRLRDAERRVNRGRPRGVAFATILTCIGPRPPADRNAWQFAGNTTRVDKYRITFPATIPAGSQVWITAMWYNSRAQASPPAAAQTTHISTGMAMPMSLAA